MNIEKKKGKLHSHPPITLFLTWNILSSLPVGFPWHSTIHPHWCVSVTIDIHYHLEARISSATKKTFVASNFKGYMRTTAFTYIFSYICRRCIYEYCKDFARYCMVDLLGLCGKFFSFRRFWHRRFWQRCEARMEQNILVQDCAHPSHHNGAPCNSFQSMPEKVLGHRKLPSNDVVEFTMEKGSNRIYISRLVF